MSGFGDAPFGSGPFGAGTPASSAGRPTALLLTDARGRPQGSLAIDPRTRSWTFDANGRRVGMPNVEHLLIWRLTTVKNSSAWVDGGLEEAPGVINDDIADQTESRVRAACADIVDAALLLIQSVTVQVQGSRVVIVVVWDDLTTGETNRRTAF